MKNMHKFVPGMLCAAVFSVAVAIGGSAMTAKPVQAAETLKVGYYIGEKHPLVSHGINVFMEEVKQATNGEIDFRVFPAGQLFKPRDTVRSLQTGIADIGLVVMPYHREEFPLSQVINVPHGWTPWELTNSYMRASVSPGLIKDEWEKNGLVPLVFSSNAAYEIHTAKLPLPDMASVKGMKIRSSGGVFDDIVTSIGAVPVAIKTPEIVEAIERGTIDATVYAFSNWGSYKLGEVLNHTTVNSGLPGPSGLVYAISKKVFDKLTPEQRQAVLDAGRKASITAQTQTLDMNVEALAELKAKGLKTYEWPAEDVAALKKTFEPIRAKWVSDMEASNHPGKKVLEELEAFHKTAAEAPEDLPAHTLGDS
ncbi:TRAP transporter substrate-binding protein DctP [Sneathiella sp.]|jgi:TRAP-type C4-dicarboxylate transport system substrate-binding protein|uniref:TRAP transporter substrate-binding protein DctP n=1 Tax=Sneathiella sp. TaxID=1964365 RepID=UPI0025CD8C92|nr:TRAP transporter substrate-binding protein DctP [Sneathiella sp.]